MACIMKKKNYFINILLVLSLYFCFICTIGPPNFRSQSHHALAKNFVEEKESITGESKYQTQMRQESSQEFSLVV